MREVERQHEYEEYKDRKGEIINGVVRRVEFGNVTVEAPGKAEAVMRRDLMLPRETFRPGRPGAGAILDVRPDSKDRKLSYPVPARSLWLNCLPRKYLKYITKLSKSRPWRVILAAGLNSRFIQGILTSIR